MAITVPLGGQMEKTMSAHNSNAPYSESNREQARLDQARLDEAVRRADDLLVSSLKNDDRRRWRRRMLVGAGFAVLAIVLVVFAVSSTVAVRLDSTAVAGDS